MGQYYLQEVFLAIYRLKKCRPDPLYLIPATTCITAFTVVFTGLRLSVKGNGFEANTAWRI